MYLSPAAVPIHSVSTSSNGVTLLTVFLATLLILTLLCTFKLLFKKSRQSWFGRLGALTPAPTPSGIIARFLSKLAHPRSGFLVGFLGSPTWETSVTLAVHNTLRERRRSFFAVEHPPCTGYKCLHPGCSNNTLKESTSTFSFGQVLELSSPAYKPHSEKAIDDCTPRLPPPALFDNWGAVTRSNVQHTQIKRSNSTKARRCPMSGVDTVFIAPLSPPKVPDDSVKHISPLSLPPLFGLGPSEQYTKQFNPATETFPASLSPSLKTVVILSSDDVSRQCSLITENSVASCAAMKADCERPLLSCQTTPLFNSYTDLDDVTLSTLPPINPVALFKLRPRHRISSIKAKRSPPLGPSPLRRMILPESFDSDSSSKADPESPTMLFEQDICNPVESPECDLSSDKRRATNRADSRTIEDNEPDPLLGLIHELVEEVNDWDKSLIMDENFKSMIEKSQVTPSKKDQRRLSTTQSHVISPCLDVFEGKARGVLRTNSNECSILSGGGQLITFWEDNRAHDIGIAR